MPNHVLIAIIPITSYINSGESTDRLNELIFKNNHNNSNNNKNKVRIRKNVNFVIFFSFHYYLIAISVLYTVVFIIIVIFTQGLNFKCNEQVHLSLSLQS